MGGRCPLNKTLLNENNQKFKYENCSDVSPMVTLNDLSNDTMYTFDANNNCIFRTRNRLAKAEVIFGEANYGRLSCDDSMVKLIDCEYEDFEDETGGKNKP